MFNSTISIPIQQQQQSKKQKQHHQFTSNSDYFCAKRYQK